MTAGDTAAPGRLRPRRVLVGTWGSYGDLHPALGLARAMRARGHHVTVATSPTYRTNVERAGVAFHPVRPDVDPDDRATIARIMDAGRGTAFLFREVLMPAVAQAYDDLRPAAAASDLLVSHPVTFALPILAEELRKPWASYVLAPMSFFSAYDVPVFPNATWLRRAGERSAILSRALVGIARRMTRGWTQPVAQLRAARGLPVGSHPIYEGQHSPHLVLALCSRLLAAPQPDWPPHVVTTGAITYDAHETQGLPAALGRFLEAGSSPVVFTLGTSAVGAAGRFYEESLDAVRQVGCRAVLLIGRHPENVPAGPLPDGVIAVEYAPHAELFPHAAAIVHQGGAGTLHHALAAGHPMLVVPHAHDQPDNADRARRLGVARVLSPGRYRAARVARDLRVLLADARYREAARRVGEIVRSEDGARTACDALERLLARTTERGYR